MKIIDTMVRALFFGLVALASLASFSTEKERYVYTVDLTRVNDDKLFVELQVPPIKKDDILYYFPKIIPGTYSIADYGRFVSDLQAMDKKGRNLPVERIDDNTWKISSAKKLKKVTYWIEDSYDTELDGPEIFEPAGTNFEEGKNFVINTAGFFGYFEGMKEIPFNLRIVRSNDFYGGTGLIPVLPESMKAGLTLEGIKQDVRREVDYFRVEDYDRLIDSPLMYSQADTAVVKVSNTEVLIASYSPNDKVSAREIANTIHEILAAQSQYLGGKLPVDKYAFVFYFTDRPVTSYGALEHSYSSFYYMPEMGIKDMEQQLRDFAAHEFFHIITPLTVHSEEIDNFDFNDPQMSRHLWMYEGVTEYFAGNVQVKYDIISPEAYLQLLRQKMMTASNFNDTLPFTQLSKQTLDKYQDQYFNVYMKGALIGLCLDLKLLSLSRGEYGLQELMLDLSSEFGKNSAFQDEELFNIISAKTYPEIAEFFTKYVEGPNKLPLEEVFALAGVTYKDQETIMDLSIGLESYNLGLDQERGKLYIANDRNLNDFGKKLGFQRGDILLKINGEEIPNVGPALPAFFERQQAGMAEGKTFRYTVLRADKDGDLQETELGAAVVMIERPVRYLLEFIEYPTEAQQKVRNAWLKAD